MRRFLHHIAQFAGQHQLALAIHDRGLGTQDGAADLSPRQTRHQPDFALLVRQHVAELDYSEEVVNVFRIDGDVVGLALFHHLTRDFAADVSNLALQVANARFPRIGADKGCDGLVGELEVLFREPRLRHLLLDQKLFRNLNLFQLRVTVQPQHFHAILQRGRNRVDHVRGGDEEHLREVVLHIQVVVDEHEILLGIEDFEQRCRRVTAEIHRHLVDFIQHEDRVLGAGLLHHLDNLPGQCTDVCAPVAADFGFVSHPAQRHANELASGSLGDGHA